MILLELGSSAVHRLCVIGSPRGAAEKFDAKQVHRVGIFLIGSSRGGLSGATRSPRLLFEMKYFRWNSQKSRLILKG